MPRPKREAAGKTKNLEKVAAEATEASKPNLIAKISNMPSIKASTFTSKAGKVPGLIAEAIQSKGIKRTGINVAQNLTKGNFSIDSTGGPKKLQVFPKLSKPSYASTAMKEQAEQKLGNLLAVNRLLQRGNLLGAEILSQRSKTKSVLRLPSNTSRYLDESSIADPQQEKYNLVLADILNDTGNAQKYVDAINNGLYDRYDSTIIMKAIKKAHDILRIRAPRVERSVVTRNVNGNHGSVQGRSRLSAADALKLGSQIHLPENKDDDDFLNEPEAPSGKDEAHDDDLQKLIAGKIDGMAILKQNIKSKNVMELRAVLSKAGIPYKSKDTKKALRDTIEAEFKSGNKQLILQVFEGTLNKFIHGKGITKTKKYTSHKIKPSLDVDRATTKLELILGEIGGGNDSKLAKNQAADLVQYLLLNQEISKDMAKDILNKVFA